MPTPPPLPSLIQSHPCLLTLQSHHTADHNDVSSFPFLHIRHHFLDHSDHSEEIGLKHFLHLFDGDALHWAHKADTCIIDCSGEGEKKNLLRTYCVEQQDEDIFYSLRTSTCRSLMPLIHCLTDSSLHTSSTARKRVFPYVSPAASSNLSLRFRSRIVAMTVNRMEKCGREGNPYEYYPYVYTIYYSQ